MPFRTLSRIALSTGLFVACVSSVRAEPSSAGAAQSEAGTAVEAGSAREQSQAETAQPKTAFSSLAPEDVAGFDLLPSFSYGLATTHVWGLRVEPYAATFGLETGYSWRRGFRLGAYFHYGLGRTVQQDYQPRRGDPFPVPVESSNFVTGLSLGYDLPLRFLVLRYTLGLGLSWMKWDFGALPERLTGYTPDKGTVLGFHLTPGLTVLWPVRVFEWGVGFDYLVQVEDRIPPGILVKLLLGVKL